MGTWDHGSFDNDTASDWAYCFTPPKKSFFKRGKPDLFAYPASAIDVGITTKAGEWLDSTECEEAIAAAECIAAAKGRPTEGLPEEVESWLGTLEGQQPKPDLIQRAIQVMNRVRNDEKSDLRVLWSEQQEDKQPDPKWLACMDDLIARLGS
tara:strand:- start:75 stop:530 length:456 start_codon:yes stop_codon:yes gene_type:complete